MSKRYRGEAICPHCGLAVAAKVSTGELRAHSKQAVDAGFYKAPCAQNSREGQELQARDHRSAAAGRRREFWQSRDHEATVSAEGTAQPLRRQVP